MTRFTPTYACVLVLGSALSVAACSGGEAQTAKPAAAPGPSAAPAVPVTLDKVIQKPMPLAFSVIGAATAYSTVSIHAQVAGLLTSVSFKEGDEVKQGDVLFTLDRRPFEATLHQAEATLQRDVAQLANAVAQAKRYDDLLNRGIATREQVDQMRSNAAALEATVNADRATIESARVQLGYTTIAAPISGRTGMLMVHAGNLVQPTDTTPLVVINQISPIYVTFAIPESQLPDFKRYMAEGTVHVDARPPNDTGPAASGHITFVDNQVDPTTGTIKIKGTFPNEDRRLWPGLFVNVKVTLTTEANAVVVPSLALQTGQQGQYVFVVKPDQTVDLRAVTVERTSGTETIIKSGLTPGETIVVDGQLRLVAGSRIADKSTPAPKATP